MSFLARLTPILGGWGHKLAQHLVPVNRGTPTFCGHFTRTTVFRGRLWSLADRWFCPPSRPGEMLNLGVSGGKGDPPAANVISHNRSPGGGPKQPFFWKGGSPVRPGSL